VKVQQVRRLRRAKSEKEKVTDTEFFIKGEMSRSCGRCHGGIRELKLALNLHKSGCNES
jgi:hypothetical protein